MKPFSSSAVGLKLGLVLSAAVYLTLRWRFPAFFSEGPGESIGFVVELTLVPAVIGFVLGLFTRRGGAIGLALLALVIGGGFALLDLPTPSPAVVGSVALGAAFVAFLVARRPWFETRKASAACGGLAAALLIAAAVAPAPPRAPTSDHPKILVFGLDAGTWTILDELFAKDELPNLRSVRDGGTSGVLLSEIDSQSPRVWTTIASGKLPSKHGVSDFFCTQNKDLKTRRIWEMLQARGWSVGLFQWLITWPPDAFDPFIVPAWMARGPQTQPVELGFIKELELAFQNGDLDGWLSRGETMKAITKLRDWGRGYLQHGLRWKTALRVASLALGPGRDAKWELQYAAKRTIQLLINGDVYLDLYRRHQPDFSCFICYGTDNLAHKFWQYHYPDDFGIPHEKAEPFANLLTDYYRDCDRLLGEILPLTTPQTTLAVLSDHGFTSVGFGGDSHQHEHRPKMNRIATLLGLTEADVAASSIATHGFFVPRAGAASADVGSRILAFLGGCTAKNGGAKVFTTKVDDSGEIEVAMNSTGDFTRESEIDTPLGPMTYGDLADIEDRTGNHSIEGIVLLRGPNLRRGAHLQGARLQDITPTLLYLHDQPVGVDMDGNVLYDAIEPGFHEEHELARIQSWDEEIAAPVRDASITGDDRAMKGYATQLGYIAGADSKEPAKSDPANAPGKDGARTGEASSRQGSHAQEPSGAKTTFDVVLTNAGEQKIAVIREVRAIANLGLKDAKDLVDGAPKVVKSGLSRAEADAIRKRLTDVGASVEIR